MNRLSGGIKSNFGSHGSVSMKGLGIRNVNGGLGAILGADGVTGCVDYAIALGNETSPCIECNK